MVNLDIYNKNMRVAISLAKKGAKTVTPNPSVGCVIVREDLDNKVLGVGYHQKSGEPHAEVYALNDAVKNYKSLVKGSTVFVTLEPCSHFGKTPPCADKLIKAQVKKIVIGSIDSNPSVSGKGIEKLEKAGIEVVSCVLKEECDDINKGFFKRMNKNIPFVTIKMAISLDGKIATKIGDSKWITGAEARTDVQELRSCNCGILTSSKTVIDDDPSLNVRLKNTKRQPARIISDTNLTIPKTSKILSLAGNVIIFHSSKDKEKIEALKKYAKLIELPLDENKRTSLTYIFQKLAELNFNNILVEAGGTFAGAVLETGFVDELLIYQSPMIIGNEGIASFCLSNINKITDCYSFNLKECSKIGKDIKLIFN